MSSINMTTGVEYQNKSGKAQNAVIQGVLSGGTAAFNLRSFANQNATVVKTFSTDEIVSVLIPNSAFYSATLTGAAAITINIDD